jgi:hypothetical protein
MLNIFRNINRPKDFSFRENFCHMQELSTKHYKKFDSILHERLRKSPVVFSGVEE